MFKVRRPAIIASMALVCAGASVPVLLGAATAPQDFDPSAVSEVSSSFDDAQTSVDALPEFLQNGAQALDVVQDSSTRLLGTADGVKYWVAADTNENACLIALLPGKGEYAAMTCNKPDIVLEQGITLQVGDEKMADTAVLLPSGYEADVAGYSLVGEQLLVGDGTESLPEFTAVPSDDIPNAAEPIDINSAAPLQQAR